MNPLFAQYTPFFLAVIAVGLGVIHSNSRITDIKDLIKSESNALRSEMQRIEGTLVLISQAYTGGWIRSKSAWTGLSASG